MHSGDCNQLNISVQANEVHWTERLLKDRLLLFIDLTIYRWF